MFEDTLLPAQNGDLLELDELWSFVQKKTQECWLWVALCRRTRQVVAYTLGDRSQEGALSLREHVPEDYRRRATPTLFPRGWSVTWKPSIFSLPATIWKSSKQQWLKHYPDSDSMSRASE